MAKIAILGFGTVGSGVYEVLCRNAAGVSRRAGEPVEVKYILDPKDFSNHPDAHLFIKELRYHSGRPGDQGGGGDHRRHPLCVSVCKGLP